MKPDNHLIDLERKILDIEFSSDFLREKQRDRLFELRKQVYESRKEHNEQPFWYIENHGSYLTDEGGYIFQTKYFFESKEEAMSVIEKFNIKGCEVKYNG